MNSEKKYKKIYCKEIVKFFNIPHTVEKYEITTDKNGEKCKTVERPNPLPTFEKFAVSIGVDSQTLKEWSKEHPEFKQACKQCKELQKDMLNDLAMRGFYNPTYTIFVAKNITDMKEKQENNNGNYEEAKNAYLSALRKLGEDTRKNSS